MARWWSGGIGVVRGSGEVIELGGIGVVRGSGEVE